MSKQTLREALVKLKQELFDRTDGNGIPLLHYVSNPVCKLVDEALAQSTGSQPHVANGMACKNCGMVITMWKNHPYCTQKVKP